MLKKIDVLWLIAGLITVRVCATVNAEHSNWVSSENDHNFLTFVKELEDKTSRSQLRKFVGTFRTIYKSALRGLDYDAALLKNRVQEIWRTGMRNIFQNPSTESKVARDRILASLPFTLNSRPSAFPEDPYVNDPMFFKRLFHLRAPWRSFHYASNANLTLVYVHYKKLWMKTYANKTLLSDAVFMWFEHTLERLVSIVIEWEIHGIGMDEDDVWQNGISSEVIPPEVLDSYNDDNLYGKRMFRHDHSRSTSLFYGLPNGFRLPGLVPVQDVGFAQARNELSEAVARLSDDCDHYEYTMNHLARVANQYLKATAVMDKKFCLDAPTCSRLTFVQDATIDAARVLDCAAIKRSTGLDQETDTIFFSGNSFIGVYNFGDAFYTQNRFEELVYDCVRGKEITSRNLAHRIDNECRNDVSHRVMTCARRLLHQVSDPGTLVRTSTVHADENTEMTLTCGTNEVLRVTHVQIYVKKELSAYAKTGFGLFLPPIFYGINRNDMKERSLSAIKYKCDGKNKCSVYTNIDNLSDHSTVYNLIITVEQECAPRGCNPELYEEKTVKAYENDGLNWQCRNSNEGILITSAVWDTQGSLSWLGKYILVGPPVAFHWNEDDMNDKTLKYLRKHCQGKNKCDHAADLDGITGHSTWFEVYVEVKYKCLPCQEFLRN